MNISLKIKKKMGDFCLDVDLTTDAKVLGLLGASGCGKSMTLKCIAGVETPDEGRIVVNDRVLFDSEAKIDLPPAKRHVGYLFQDYALFPNMTVKKNIRCVAGSEEKTGELIRRYALSGTENLYPGQISGGQKQRVALARMMASDPEVILLDEPFSALDSFLKTRMEREILNVLDTFEGPVVFVSHDRNECYRITDTIAVMENGRIDDLSEKHELFRAPKTLAAMLLTGCKNVTRLQKKENGDYTALDWGITLKGPKERTTLYRYAAFRAHYAVVIDQEKMEETNTVKGKVFRELEDTFSDIVQFYPEDLKEISEYSLLTYETDKETRKKQRERYDDRISIKIPEDVLIWMEG